MRNVYKMRNAESQPSRYSSSCKLCAQRGVSAASLWASCLNCLFLIFSSGSYLKFQARPKIGLFINLCIIYYAKNIQYKTTFLIIF